MMQMIEQADEGDRHHLGAADDRRQFAFAVGDRRAFVRAGKLAFAGKGFVGGDLAARGLAVEGLAADGLAGEGLVGITLTMVFPCPKRR